MPTQRGFSLTEVVIALVIISALAAVAVPYYLSSSQQSASQAARTNLITIYHAERNYYFQHGPNYCSDLINDCMTLAQINNTLSLHITDNNFTYFCLTGGPNTACVATHIAAPFFQLAVSMQRPIVLPGGNGLLNPACSPSNSPLCPN